MYTKGKYGLELSLGSFIKKTPGGNLDVLATNHFFGVVAPVSQSVLLPGIGAGSEPVIQVQKKLYASTADSTTHNISLDTIPIEGNTLILACSSGSLITTPSGWTRVDGGVTFVEGAIFRKTAGASESSTVSVTIGSDYPFSAVFLEYSGLTGDVDQFGDATAQGGSGTVTTPSISTTVADCLVVALAAIREEGAPITAWSNSFVEEGKPLSTNSADADVSAGVATRLVSATGSYSTAATLTANGIGGDVAVIAAFPIKQQDHGNIVFSPTIVVDTGISIVLPLLAEESIVYSPSIVPGPVSVSLPLIEDDDIFYSPSLVPGAISVVLPLLGDENIVYNPSFFPGAVSISLPLLGEENIAYNPSVLPGPITVSLQAIDSENVIYLPTIVPGAAVISIPLLPSENILFEPSLVPGPVSLSLAFINEEGQLFLPTLVPGSISVSLPLFGDENIVFDPSLVPEGVFVSLPLLQNEDELYPFSLIPGPVVIVVDGIPSDNQVFDILLLPGAVSIELPLIPSDNQVFPPGLIVSGVRLKLWNGAVFEVGKLKLWTGTQFIEGRLRRHLGDGNFD